MKKLLGKLVKAIAYTVAGLVILLAIGVGLLRLFLPRLPEYQDQIKAWAGDAIGVDVEFSGMDARWGLSGPELEFLDAELIRRDNQVRIVAADEVSISIALIRLVAEQTVAIDRVVVRDSAIELRQLEDGSFRVQGGDLSELLPESGGQSMPVGGFFELIGEDIELRLIQPGDERPKRFDIGRFTVRSDAQRIAVTAAVDLPEELGDELGVTATYLTALPEAERFWDISVQLDDLDLPGVSSLLRNPDLLVDSGYGDIELSMALDKDGVQSAAVSIDVEALAKNGMQPVALQSNVEYRRDQDGWLLAANRLRLTTGDGEWPETSFRIDTGLDDEGRLALLDAQADYLNLRDLALFTPLFDDRSRGLVEALSPRGEVRGLDATLAGLGGENLRYTLSVDVDRLGFEAYEQWPGLRGFSGRVRADEAGGRLELRSENLQLQLFDYLTTPIDLETARGTVIWRRSGERTTVLSDNITVQNADLTAETNVQLTIDGDNAPVIDLASQWSLTDLGSAKRYIPEKILHPNLYNWFQNALLSGRIENGTTRLYGPLDKYPFDNGEGRFLLEATVEDSLFKYLRQWPASELKTMDVVLDNTRLYTTNNLSYAEGREIRDARVEIADLRDPVLTIEGDSTGDMESLVQFAKNSPIDALLGGRLDSIDLEGFATTDLDLTVPLKQWREFEFTAGVNTEGATMRIEGLQPAITDITGRVVIEKEDISTEGLTATFLGDSVEVALQRAPEDMAGYQVIAKVEGNATAEGLVNEFEIPIDTLVRGEAEYTATILFPGGGGGMPLAIGLATDLEGFGIELPDPFGKALAGLQTMQGDIRFVDNGIQTAGRTEDFAWNIYFTGEGQGALTFERGTLELGDVQAAEEPQTRGLHLRGELSQFDLGDWLQTSSDTEADTDFVSRIRSVDITVGDLALLGQRYEDHSIRVDRSARDWLIQVSGDSVEGQITLPYEFSAETTLVLDMQRLLLPGDELAEDKEPGEPLDPRKLPAISLKAQEFAIGERYVGAIEADIARTDEGLVADRIVANDDSFEIFGNGSWIADETDPSGYRTSLVGGLRSTDIKATMSRLNYQPGINGDDLSVLSDVSWSGGPTAEFLASLDGEVQVRFGAGQLDDIDPGAGRVFGLMSIVALPRRLSLDFSDVFQKGFAFDKIEGTFRIVDGDTYTCNLSLEGPAAQIGIVGRAGLVTQDYEQSAIVSANFGNSLPIGVGLVAGPQAAVAALIFSQIFKKPLQDLSQVYYDIEGSWDQPSMVGADAESFANKGRLASCVNGDESP